jgi:DNA polymerase-3 subunit beta
MRLVCIQENLKHGLDVVGRAVATRTTLPITQSVLLTAEDNRLKLSATNLEIAISCWVPGQVDEPGSLAIPARLLSEFVGSLPSGNVELTTPAKGNQLQIKASRNEARMSGQPAEDFPPIPAVGDGTSIQLDPELLKKAIGRVVFAAATDESRPVLTGVHAEFDGAELTLAAADGFRLSVHKVPLVTPVTQPTSVVVPAKAFSELHRLIGDQTDPVEVTISTSGAQLMFRTQQADMVSQIIQGTFPNYQQLIPKASTSHCVLDVAEFLRAVRTASVFARDGSGIVRLQIGNGDASGKVVVSARAEEVGDNTGELDATIEGDPSKIAFNSRYLTDVLAELGAGQVTLETTSPSSPGVFHLIGSDDYTHVVMPMFVQW